MKIIAVSVWLLEHCCDTTVRSVNHGRVCVE